MKRNRYRLEKAENVRRKALKNVRARAPISRLPPDMIGEITNHLTGDLKSMGAFMQASKAMNAGARRADAGRAFDNQVNDAKKQARMVTSMMDMMSYHGRDPHTPARVENRRKMASRAASNVTQPTYKGKQMMAAVFGAAAPPAHEDPDF